MFDKVLDMVKTKNLVVPGMIFFHLEELGLKYDELYVIIYILNLSNKEFDMVTMSSELNMKPKELLRIVNELTEKNYVKLDLVKKENNVCEHFNLDGLYNKLAFNIIGKEEKEEIQEPTNTLFDEFEKEFKRPLTPKEFQIINAWKEVGYTEELIILALHEATYNGAYSVAYIDKVLSAWDNKGIKNAQDVERNRQEFNKKKEEIEEIDEEYDWLNE